MDFSTANAQFTSVHLLKNLWVSLWICDSQILFSHFILIKKDDKFSQIQIEMKRNILKMYTVGLQFNTWYTTNNWAIIKLAKIRWYKIHRIFVSADGTPILRSLYWRIHRIHKHHSHNKFKLQHLTKTEVGHFYGVCKKVKKKKSKSNRNEISTNGKIIFVFTFQNFLKPKMRFCYLIFPFPQISKHEKFIWFCFFSLFLAHTSSVRWRKKKCSLRAIFCIISAKYIILTWPMAESFICLKSK